MTIIDDITYARNQIYRINGVINGLDEALSEVAYEKKASVIEKLHSLQQEMEDIIIDLYYEYEKID